MKGWGISAATIAAVRQTVTDCWHDGPGGWTHEWTAHARLAEQAGKYLEAATLYGAAKFPVLATSARQRALQNQVRTYLAAAPSFPCRFERLLVPVAYRNVSVDVPVHVFQRRGALRPRPLVCLSGGVDTLKMELHRVALMLALLGGFRVAVLDMPGTGESPIALARDGDAIYRGVIGHLNHDGGRTAIMGISFGGHWAARLAFDGQVDAAVNIGGPVGFGPADASLVMALPNGMTGIIANALGLKNMPGQADAAALLSAFSIDRRRLDQLHCPLLVINGDQDPYIARQDTLGFEGVAGAHVWLVKGASHCAAEHFARVLIAAVGWLRVQLHGANAANRATAALSKALLPTLASQD